MKQKNKRASNKYNLGAFVTKNQQAITGITNAAGAIAPIAGNQAVSGALSGLSMGASVGSLFPGVGTLVGGAVGLVGGAVKGIFDGNAEKKAKQRAIKKANDIRHGQVVDAYESEIDYTNENPYGVYAEGGDVDKELINIEKGELQIDPTTGKILREYTGINPETGGKYEPHKKKGKDTKHNMVTAEVDTFIITSKEGNKYKKAVDTNDKLAQNTIMANIRNAKREASKKYATGGGVYKHNTGVYNPSNLAYLKGQLSNTAPAGNNTGLGVGNILESALNFLPALTNIGQSRQTPNYLNYRPASMNVGLRQKTLASLPTEVSINPVLNSITGSIDSVDRDIVGSTSNSSISRALRSANAISGRRAINDAYVNNNNMNNNIRMNRASVYSNLGAQDQQRSAINAQMMLGVDTENRQMDLAKQQQLNYGISQAQQMAQTLRGNKLKGNRELEMIELMKQIFPNASDFLTNYRGGR